MLHVSRAQLRAASQEFSAAERMQSSMTSEHALSGQVTGWTLAIKARLGMLDEARAARTAIATETSVQLDHCWRVPSSLFGVTSTCASSDCGGQCYVPDSAAVP